MSGGSNGKATAGLLAILAPLFIRQYRQTIWLTILLIGYFIG